MIMEVIKRFAGKGERAPCYFYRTTSGIEVDLLVDYGSYFNAYEIKFTSTPKSSMIKPLERFREEFSVKTTSLLNLREKPLPMTKEIVAMHWSMCEI